MAINVKYNGSSLEKNLGAMSTKLGAVLLMYAATKSSQYEAMMKTQRTWTDRSGMAKATLNSKVSRPDDSTIRITLSHGVSYGIWLELANEKRYAVIAPLIRAEGPKLVENLGSLMSKLG